MPTPTSQLSILAIESLLNKSHHRWFWTHRHNQLIASVGLFLDPTKEMVISALLSIDLNKMKYLYVSSYMHTQNKESRKVFWFIQSCIINILGVNIISDTYKHGSLDINTHYWWCTHTIQMYSQTDSFWKTSFKEMNALSFHVCF
jgi:hypothetical protein